MIWRGAFWRLIDASEAATPGTLRLIVNRHVTELSWLAKPEREQLFSLLQVIDESMRQELKPTKINIASLGNQVPHMHWHIIPAGMMIPTFRSRFGPPPSATQSVQSRMHGARLLKDSLQSFLNSAPKQCTSALSGYRAAQARVKRSATASQRESDGGVSINKCSAPAASAS